MWGGGCRDEAAGTEIEGTREVRSAGGIHGRMTGGRKRGRMIGDVMLAEEWDRGEVGAGEGKPTRR